MDQTKVESYYDRACRESTESWQASLWLSAEDQYYRYVLMGQLIDWKGCTVLDVGCGQGDFYQFIRDRSANVTYTGIDISQEMISAAQKKYPKGNFAKVNFLEYEGQFDYVFGIGTFAVKLGDHHVQMDYLRQSINKMFQMAKRAVGITLSSDKAAVQMRFEQYYHYYEPSLILDSCLDITPSVIMNHSSLPLEMVIFLHKDHNE